MVADSAKLVDLSPMGCPVFNYAVMVKSLEINDKPVATDSVIYAIIDTGTTGCIMSDDLANDEDTPNLKRKERVVQKAMSGREVSLEAKATRDEIFMVSAVRIPWFYDDVKEGLRDMGVSMPMVVTVLQAAAVGDEEDECTSMLRTAETLRRRRELPTGRRIGHDVSTERNYVRRR